MSTRLASALAFASAMLVGAAPAFAIGLATEYSAPLTRPYPVCNEEDSVTDCPGVYAVASPWLFTDGAVEISENTVSLRLDDLRLVLGQTCSAATGASTNCNCWGNDQNSCNSDSNCGQPPVPCGPNSDVPDFFIVRIFQQNFMDDTIPPLEDGIKRSTAGCHQEVAFDLKNIQGNRNQQVNETITLSTPLSCHSSTTGVKPEIRHIDVYDKFGNMVAVASHSQ